MLLRLLFLALFIPPNNCGTFAHFNNGAFNDNLVAIFQQYVCSVVVRYPDFMNIAGVKKYWLHTLFLPYLYIGQMERYRNGQSCSRRTLPF